MASGRTAPHLGNNLPVHEAGRLGDEAEDEFKDDEVNSLLRRLPSFFPPWVVLRKAPHNIYPVPVRVRRLPVVERK